MNEVENVRNYDWGEIGRRFLPLVKPYRWRVLWAAVLVALVGLAVSVMPLRPAPPLREPSWKKPGLREFEVEHQNNGESPKNRLHFDFSKVAFGVPTERFHVMARIMAKPPR
jgi:hypothetical protein